MSYINKLKLNYHSIEYIAGIIHENNFSEDNFPVDGFWKSAKEYQLGKLGNLNFFTCLKSAIAIFEYTSKSEMSDMIGEFGELDWDVIDY